MQRNSISSNVSKNLKDSKYKKSIQYLIPEF